MWKPKKRLGRKAKQPVRGISPLRSRPRSAPPDSEAAGNTPRFPIVGLGASAGGLEALQQFIGALGPSTGMAFVVITHQHPTSPTLLPEILGKHADLPVLVIRDGAKVEPNKVYVAPPGPRVSLHSGRFHFEEAGEKLRGPLPIDHFFRSLAKDHREAAIGIVLSGTGSDGTLGIAEIKGAGGFVLAQDADSARFAGMPTSAAATHLVDGLFKPEDMPQELARLLSRRAGPLTMPVLDTGAAVQRLLQTLRLRTGNDFTSYKKSTVLRRIERRMNVRGFSDVHEYSLLLDSNHEEADILFRELLISVTGFFRDPEVFEALRTELRAKFEKRDETPTFRAWVAACATGEEAYSLAIIMKELMSELGKNVAVQIFATDLDPHAVDAARAGRYPLGISADVSPERLERFFSKHEDEYRIKKEVRELIVFAAQNVIKDPPFTRLDLVSCRNLLIYLEPELQRRVLSLFSYALQPDGLLLLGGSENVSGNDDAFIGVDKKNKLFKRLRRRIEPPAEFPEPPHLPSSVRAPRPRGADKDSGGLGLIAERVLLAQLTPASVLASERGEIAYFHGRTGQFLEPASGEPAANLFNMAREGLRLELPSAMRQATERNEPVVRSGLCVKSNGGFISVKLTVRRLQEPELVRDLFLVSFELEPDAAKRHEESGEPQRERGPEAHRLRDLELELEHTRESLQGTIEELETSNEELKSTNEELQSTNEELQSANEELETSREEMQSLNEELQTVNSELEERNLALSQSNDDMQNLLNSTDIATVFLDDRLVIRRFTTQARRVFSLIDTDIGRPLSDLTANVRYDSFVQDARDVLQTLVFHEREIQTKEGAWRLMRIMPYRTAENLIDGLVMTFIDIDRIKQNERHAEETRSFVEEMLEALPNGVAVLDATLAILRANTRFYEILRTSEKRSHGERLFADNVLDSPELALELERVIAERTEFKGYGVKTLDRLRTKDLVFSARPFRLSGRDEPVILLTIEDLEKGQPA